MGSCVHRTRIVLVDGQTLFRKGLASLLASQLDFEVVGEAATGTEAMERIHESTPHMVLMDLAMASVDGLTRRITACLPDVRVVMLTASEEEPLGAGIQTGARGCVLKTIEPEALFAGLRAVMQGGTPAPTMVGKLLGELSRMARTSAPRRLAPRERAVLALLTQGKSNKEIAAALSMAENTVKNHLKSILEKLDLKNRVQAATFALRHGLVA
jgi:two-component system nitrate/nitrite response regulator NarL